MKRLRGKRKRGSLGMDPEVLVAGWSDAVGRQVSLMSGVRPTQ